MRMQTTLALSGTLLVGLLGGAVLTGMAGGQTGPSGVTLWGPAGHTGPNPWQLTVKVAGIPTHEQMAEVSSTTPLTVPTGKVFVLTGMMVLDVSPDPRVSIGGVLKAEIGGPYPEGAYPIPPGVVASAGQVVTATASCYAVGYLADA